MKRDNASINGLLGNETNPRNTTDPASPRVPVTENAIDLDPGTLDDMLCLISDSASLAMNCGRISSKYLPSYLTSPDAGHSVEDTTEQVFGTASRSEPQPWPAVAPMNGFVQNAEGKHAGWGPQVWRVL